MATTLRPKKTRGASSRLYDRLAYRSSPKDPKPRALAEAKSGIQALGRVVGINVQERGQPALRYAASGMRRQRRAEAGAPGIRVNADRAQFDKAGQAQALAGHRDQPVLAADSPVAAEQDGIRAKRSRLGDFDQRQHLGRIRGAERYDLAVRRRLWCHPLR